ncbi:MAG: DUF2231 domain-containing protein [Lewinellaceae bacterium]|nr:DUF2231 domain-containing protein [Lewinellaceae bacterium]
MISATHLHAMLVHFPIAILFVGFFSEILGLVTKKDFFKKAGFYLLILGTAGAVASYFSGDAAGEGMEDGTLGQAIELHENAAIWSIILATATVGTRLLWETMKTKKNLVYAFSFLLYTGTIGVVSYTGYLGGQLVYKHAAGVELGLPAFNDTQPAESNADVD